MTGTNRRKMLARLFEEHPEALRVRHCQGRIKGYVTMRPGANAVQIGPCVAANDVGPPLLSDAINRCAGQRVFVDVPLDNEGAMGLVQSYGLEIQRCFTRMYRGKPISDTIRALWASSSPEKG